MFSRIDCIPKQTADWPFASCLCFACSAVIAATSWMSMQVALIAIVIRGKVGIPSAASY